MQLNPAIGRQLFSKKISRNEIVNFDFPFLRDSTNITINVWRNTGVELFIPIIEKYLKFFNFKTDFNLSGYDSSFDLRTWELADLDLIYTSIESSNIEETLDLLITRVKYLINCGARNISLVIQTKTEQSRIANKLLNFEEAFPDVQVLLISEEKIQQDSKFKDERLMQISGNWLSADSYVVFGRLIALNVILPYLITKIKVIAVDLDNTLYNGVLAEDGVSGISQSEFQRELVSWLYTQKKQGIMLAVVSRNEIKDVAELFELFPEWKSLFDFVHASWQPKESHFEEILDITRVAADTVLFIDDSFYEIENVQRVYPNLQTILYTDEQSTLNLIEMYPGSTSRKVSSPLKIDRAHDLRSNKSRDSIFSMMSDQEAFKALKVEINFESNNFDLIERSAELSNKTNQFNFAIKRYSEYNIKDYMQNESRRVILSSLSDKFANSGIVSLMCLDYSNIEELIVDEFCISCRALGRGLEDEIFFGSLSKVLAGTTIPNSSLISISYQLGERNSPSVNWALSRKWDVFPDRIQIPISALFEWRTLIKPD